MAYFGTLNRRVFSTLMTDRSPGKVAFLFTRLGLVIGCSLARAFPRAIYWIADWLARIGFWIFFGFRKRSVDNIQVAFNTTLDQSTALAIAQRSLRNFFRASVEIATFLQVSDAEYRDRIPVEGWENLAAALAKQKGALILSAHLGNFFLAGSRLAVEGFSTHVLVNQPRDGRVAQLMDNYRLQVRQKTIHARPRRQALRELSLVLRANEIAVIIADEYRRTSWHRRAFIR